MVGLKVVAEAGSIAGLHSQMITGMNLLYTLFLNHSTSSMVAQLTTKRTQLDFNSERFRWQLLVYSDRERKLSFLDRDFISLGACLWALCSGSCQGGDDPSRRSFSLSTINHSKGFCNK